MLKKDNFIKKIKKNIESKRSSKNVYNRFLVLIKDILWFIEFNLTFFVCRYIFFNFYNLAKKSILMGAVQNEKELKKLIEILKNEKLENILEIGTYNGGTLYLWCKLATTDATIISLDLPGGNFGGGYNIKKISKFKKYNQSNQKLFFLREDSHKKLSLKKVKDILKKNKLDILFIDADHTYQGVKKDFEMYSPLVKKNGFIIFHDIVLHDESTNCKVNKFWTEIKKEYDYKEIVDNWNQRKAGLGILIK